MSTLRRRACLSSPNKSFSFFSSLSSACCLSDWPGARVEEQVGKDPLPPFTPPPLPPSLPPSS